MSQVKRRYRCAAGPANVKIVEPCGSRCGAWLFPQTDRFAV